VWVADFKACVQSAYCPAGYTKSQYNVAKSTWQCARATAGAFYIQTVNQYSLDLATGVQFTSQSYVAEIVTSYSGTSNASRVTCTWQLLNATNDITSTFPTSAYTFAQYQAIRTTFLNTVNLSSCVLTVPLQNLAPNTVY